jgi:HCO3- transporter family
MRKQTRHIAEKRDSIGSREKAGVSTTKWWKVRLFHGMINDVRRRAPYYWSDWADAWDYRVVPATIYMYFAKYVARARGSNLIYHQQYHDGN